MDENQRKVREFCRKNELDTGAEHRLLDLISELGEVSKEILKGSDYGKKKLEYREELKEELGDAYFSLLELANQLNVDLEEALEIVLKKYGKRIKKGGAGSENE